MLLPPMRGQVMLIARTAYMHIYMRIYMYIRQDLAKFARVPARRRALPARPGGWLGSSSPALGWKLPGARRSFPPGSREAEARAAAAGGKGKGKKRRELRAGAGRSVAPWERARGGGRGAEPSRAEPRRAAGLREGGPGAGSRPLGRYRSHRPLVLPSLERG